MKNNEIQIRDPFIYKENGKYYMYGSRGYQGLGFWVYISEDLENWSEPVSIFEANENFWATMNFWAPEMHKYNGRYYLFASFKSEDRCRGTQILVSDRPDGKFEPITQYPVTPSDWECLDGTLYINKEGKPYMVFCHEWLQVGDGEICAMPLSEDLTRAVGEPVLLFKASECPHVVSIKENEKCYVTDGPFLFRSNDELYMLWSSFGEKKYFEAIAKSDNGEIDGKWIFADELLYGDDGGHGMVFETFEGNMKLSLHQPNSEAPEHPVFFDLYEEDGKLYIK